MNPVTGKRRGRPPGRRNRPALQREEMPSMKPAPMVGDRLPDTESIVSRQITLLDWAQQAIRLEFQKMMESPSPTVTTSDVQRLERLSNAIVRSIEALKKSSDIADDIASRMTTDQILEAAVRKIEAQDAATVRYAIKRLRAHLDRLIPLGDRLAEQSAAESIAALA